MYENFIAARVTQLRQAKGVSARDMSLSIGQNESFINRIENRKALPSMPTFFYICEYLEISPKDFFDDEAQNPALLNELISKQKSLNDKALRSILSIVEEMQTKG